MRQLTFALRAFNVDMAKAVDVASDLRIDFMRLLWWQEAIDKLYTGKQINDPTAHVLPWVISEHKIRKSWLKCSVEARIRYAQREASDLPENIDTFEKYAEDIVLALLYNILHADGIRSTMTDHAASHIGKASGFVLLLKSLSYHCSRNRHYAYIPEKLAEKHGLLVKETGQLEIRLDPKNSREGLCNVVFDIASIANVHLLKARELAGRDRS